MKKILLTLFLGFQLLTGYSTHIIGGIITYECNGSDTLNFTMKLYRNCFAITTLNPSEDLLFESSTGSSTSITVVLDTLITIPLNIWDPCLVVPEVCVEEGTYYGTVLRSELDSASFYIYFAGCCRPDEVTNLADPGGAWASYFTTLPEDTVCNSNPYFINFPPIAMCVDEPFVMDHSAIDLDGDSLVYSICSPIDELLEEADYVAPYTASNPMGGTPPLAINPNTGMLTITPNTIGYFVVGICVSEYRDGVLLSTTNRDFVFNVSSCTPNVTASTFELYANCENYGIQFEDQSFGSVPITDVYWDFGLLGSTTDTSTASNPYFLYPDTGSYEVMLIANPYSACGDTSYTTVHIFPVLVSGFTSGYSCEGFPKEFTDLSYCTYGSLNLWSWDFGDGSPVVTGVENPSHTYALPGDYVATMIVGNDVGCVDTVPMTVTVQPKPELIMSEDQLICPYDDVQLEPSSATPVTYVWTPAYNISSTTAAFPTVSPLSTTVYSLTVTDSLGCQDNGVVEVELINFTAATAGPDQVVIKGNSTVLGGGGGSVYHWEPAYGLSNQDVANPTCTITETTEYIVRVEDSHGCVDFDTVLIEIKDPNVQIPNAFSPNKDDENDYFAPLYNGVAELYYFEIYNRWGEKIFSTNDMSAKWDGTFDGLEQPMGTYVWVLKCKSILNQEFFKSGNVALLR